MKHLKKFLTSLIVITLSLAVMSGCIITREVPSGNQEVKINVIDTNASTYNSLTEMLDAVRPSVLEIYAGQETASSYSAGSGVIFATSEMGEGESKKTYYYVLTCHHVIDGMQAFMAKDIYGNEYKTLTLIGGDPESDIAVMRFCPKDETDVLSEDKLSIATIRRTNQTTENYLKVGESVYAIGNPLGTLGGTVTQGIVSSTNREVTVEGRKMSLIQTDCAINSGNSGGGLFDAQGNLIGIVNAGYAGDIEGLNFAIPSDIAIDISDQLLKQIDPISGYGYVLNRARVMAVVASQVYGSYELALHDYSSNPFNQNSYATYVFGVKAGSIYALAGLEYLDKLVSVQINNGEVYEVHSAQGVVSYFNSQTLKKGDVVKFVVIKNGATAQTSVSVTLPQYVYTI
ncbi:MAG: trypsin-like peptidase domain-containing protein [Clostridia bacterium]|nr:trypsin-like peptidase domain-containing protein [Clostridia bacterium]